MNEVCNVIVQHLFKQYISTPFGGSVSEVVQAQVLEIFEALHNLQERLMVPIFPFKLQVNVLETTIIVKDSFPLWSKECLISGTTFQALMLAGLDLCTKNQFWPTQNYSIMAKMNVSSHSNLS